MRRVDEVERENSQLKASNSQIKTETTQASDEVKTLKEKVTQAPSPEEFARGFHNYLGTHQFTVTGAAGVDFIYDQQSGAIDGLSHQGQNTFLLDWEPMILYRLADWILFQGVFSAAFGATGTGMDLSTADFQTFLFPNLP